MTEGCGDFALISFRPFSAGRLRPSAFAIVLPEVSRLVRHREDQQQSQNTSHGARLPNPSSSPPPVPSAFADTTDQNTITQVSQQSGMTMV